MSLVESGQSWKFEHPVSNQQANSAISYLTSLGFQVRRISENSPIKLIAPEDPPSASEEVTEEVVEAEEESLYRTGNALEFSFKGDALDITALYLKLWVFSILTFGLYSFWGRIHLRQYLWSHLTCAGEPFRFRGTPRELAATGVSLILAFLAVFFFLIWLNGVDPLLTPVFEKLFFAVGLLGWFYLLWSGTRYCLSKTEWHSVPFSFKASAGEWLSFYMKGWLLFVLTIGLYGPVLWSNSWKFRMEHTAFGGKTFRYSGNWRDIALPYFIGWGVTVVTLGWGAPVWLWSCFEIKKQLLGRTGFDPGTFEFVPDLKTYAQLQAGNVIFLIFSLGLGYPCVKKRNLEYTTRHLALVDFPNWQKLIEDIKAETSQRKKQVFQNFRNV